MSTSETNLGNTSHRFDNLQKLVDYFGTLNTQGWIFRGMSDNTYSPISKLERVLQDSDVPEGEWLEVEKRSIDFFKDHAQAFIKDLPREDDLIGWLAQMQHYGAPTRLTDWTSSPFVALYFAYNSIASNKGIAALWMLNAAEFRNVFGTPSFEQMSEVSPIVLENNLLGYILENRYRWPLPITIYRPDERMRSQQACFIAGGKLLRKGESTLKEMFIDKETTIKTIENYMPPLMPGHSRENEPRFEAHNNSDGSFSYHNRYHQSDTWLKKIELPYSWHRAVFVVLSAMNITGATIYPGLSGAASATEEFIRNGGESRLWKYYAKWSR